MEHPLTAQIEELLGDHVRGSGVNGSFLCPFHDERQPSFSIHLETGLWNCFACGLSGNLEQLYKRLGEQPTDEQRQDLLIRSINREPHRSPNFTALANALLATFEGRNGQTAWESFIRSRPVRRNAASHFGVGYSNEKRALAFPYRKSDSTVCGIKYRHANGGQSWETGSERYPFNLPDCEGKGVVLIAEGESDALAAWSRVPDSVGVCGIPGAYVSDDTWRRWGVSLLFARRIYVAFDADEAGDNGADIAMRMLGDTRTVRIRPTRGKDISYHILKGGTLEELGVEEADDQPERTGMAGSAMARKADKHYRMDGGTRSPSGSEVQQSQHDYQYQPQS